MEKFTSHTGIGAPLRRSNVDTDQIIPARFLQKPRKGDYGRLLFHDLRFAPDESKRPGFVLNNPRYEGAQILVADTNFGCGSSRENAVWVLQDYGFKAVIAPSFGDIFHTNSLKNGLLVIRLPQPVISELLGRLPPGANSGIEIDLPGQRVVLPDGSSHDFEIDAFAKKCLIEGMDELAYTLSLSDEIARFEANRQQ